MAEQKQTLYMTIVNATHVGFANDDEVDDKMTAKALSKVAKKAKIDVFCYPKHKKLATQNLSEKFWKNLSAGKGTPGECIFYTDDKPKKNGKMFEDIKAYIEKYGNNLDELVVLFISGKYDNWLAALPTFANVVIVMSGGGFNPKDLTDDEMTEIAAKNGTKPRYYIDHNFSVNLEVEAYNRKQPNGSPKLPVFRAIDNEVMVKYEAEKAWEKFMTIPELADTLMDFIFVDNFSKEELLKTGTVEKFTDKLNKLKPFDEKEVERTRVMVDHMYKSLPFCSREDIQHKTPAGLRFQGAFCLARQVTRLLLDDLWADHLWYSKFFSLRSGLAEVLIDCNPNMVWGDCATGVALSDKYNSEFVPDRRDFKRNEQGYVSAMPCGEVPVGNFYTLVFRPDLPINERAERYGKICMEWWSDLIMDW